MLHEPRQASTLAIVLVYPRGPASPRPLRIMLHLLFALTLASLHTSDAVQTINRIIDVFPAYQQSQIRTQLSFVLPSEYTMETLPVPTDPNVELAMLPGIKVAVVRYSGFLSAKSIEKQGRRLRDWIEQQGLVATSTPRSAAYDPPWTIPFFRRNEVQIEIE